MVEGDIHMKNKPIILVRLFALLHVIIGGSLTVASYIASGTDFNYSASHILYNSGFFVIAQALFLIYIFALYDKKPKHVLLPIAYIFNVLHYGIYALRNFYSLSSYGTHDILTLFWNLFVETALDCIVPLAFSVFLIVICFTKFKYIKNARKLVIIATACALASTLIHVPYMIKFCIHFSQYDYTWTTSYYLSLFASLATIFDSLAIFFLWRMALPNKIKENA